MMFMAHACRGDIRSLREKQIIRWICRDLEFTSLQEGVKGMEKSGRNKAGTDIARQQIHASNPILDKSPQMP